MRIWVDADACPKAIKEILYRAAERTGIRVTLVASQSLFVPRSSRLVDSIAVPVGFDAADRRILESVSAGDLVVTADIPLAAEVVGRGALALDPRGELYSEDNVRERLATRNLLDALRDGGMLTGGPSTFGKSDRQAFANALDRILTHRSKEGG